MENFIASIYNYIYILVVAIITISYLPKYKILNPYNNFNTQSNSTGILLLSIITFIGFRPLSEKYFVDMIAYAYRLRNFAGSDFEFTWSTDNIIFDNLFVWWGSVGLGETLFFIFMASIYFGCAYYGIKRLLPNHVMIAFLVYLAAFSTFSYSTNGIKAGAAASIFILALGFYDKKIVCFPLLLMSLGFHHSMILPIAAFILTLFFKKPKWYYYGWLFCLIMACLHITYFQNLFAGFSDEQGAMYLTATKETSDAYIGFRPDFILYSAAPVWIGYQFEMRNIYELSDTFKTLMHFYLTSNAIWMLCMYASFNNRIAYLSWFIYPIVVIYPYLDKGNTDSNRFLKLTKVVEYHLYFTLFMVIVYYGILSLGR